MAKHRYRGRSNEYPGIVIFMWGYWHRITRPPYGIQLITKST